MPTLPAHHFIHLTFNMNNLPAPYRNWSPAQLFYKFQNAVRGKAYAWAQYYRITNEAHDQDHAHYGMLTTTVTLETIPTHIKAELKSMADQLRKKWECPVCLEFIADGTLQITNCGHFYCDACLGQMKQISRDRGDTKWCCAVCRKKHNLADD